MSQRNSFNLATLTLVLRVILGSSSLTFSQGLEQASATNQGDGNIAAPQSSRPTPCNAVGTGTPNFFFCDDFSAGTAERWNPQGGVWSVTDGQYIGSGTFDTFSNCGFLTNQTLIRDLEALDAEVLLDMKSIERVDKLVVLRSADPDNQIELNFRAERPGEFPADLIVQEKTNCQFTLHTPEFSVLIPPHQLGQAIHSRILLIGRRLLVWIDRALVLNRSFPFSVRTGRLGLGVIEGGVTAFDNVEVHVLKPVAGGQVVQ
jgi:hypothetical protein